MDALRGLAAAMVVAGHARWLPSMSYATYSSRYGLDLDLSTALFLALSVFQFQHEAVVVFFVVSGFAIHFREARLMAEGKGTGRLDLARFAGRRLRRLWPPLLAALALTALLDSVGRLVNPAFYRGVTAAAFSPGMPTTEAGAASDGLVYSAWSLVGGAVFLTETVAPPFGTNGALWSLSYEALYYLAYPLFLLLAWRLSHRTAFALSLAVSVFAAIGLKQGGPDWLDNLATPVTLWVAWTSGALLADRWWRRAAGPSPSLATGAGLAVGLVAASLSLAPRIASALAVGLVPAGTFRDWIWGVATWLVAYGLLFSGHPRVFGPVVDRLVALFARVGRFSYTLYVIQLPILFLISALWLRSRSELPASPWLAVGGFAVVVAVSMVLAHVVEYPFVPIRRTQEPHPSSLAVPSGVSPQPAAPRSDPA